jgi:dynein heavy chain, axonemal
VSSKGSSFVVLLTLLIDQLSPALLWCHEAIRVFADRLVTDDDRQWFHGHLEAMCNTKFNARFYDLFKHLDSEKDSVITMKNMRSLFFGDYLSTDDSKTYVEVQDMELLQKKMETHRILKSSMPQVASQWI